MKKSVAICIASAFFAANSAMAADFSPHVYTKAPLAPAPVTSWTGCYLGANVGYGWSHVDWYDPQAGGDVGSDTSNGVVGGGQAGCDYQSGNFVVGIQDMFDGADVSGSHPYTGAPIFTDHSRLSWFDTLTGRLGYTPIQSALFYVKGGAAWAHDRFTETCTVAGNGCPGEANPTRSGWTAGAGLEYMLAPQWSVLLEYDFMGFGRRTSTLNYVDGTTYNYNIQQDVQTLLVGLNYRLPMMR
jgi:outer membrane immunogenic protein